MVSWILVVCDELDLEGGNEGGGEVGIGRGKGMRGWFGRK